MTAGVVVGHARGPWCEFLGQGIRRTAAVALGTPRRSRARNDGHHQLGGTWLSSPWASGARRRQMWRAVPAAKGDVRGSVDGDIRNLLCCAGAMTIQDPAMTRPGWAPRTEVVAGPLGQQRRRFQAVGVNRCQRGHEGKAGAPSETPPCRRPGAPGAVAVFSAPGRAVARVARSRWMPKLAV